MGQGKITLDATYLGYRAGCTILVNMFGKAKAELTSTSQLSTLVKDS